MIHPRSTRSLLIVLCAALFLASCKKDEAETSTPASPAGGTTSVTRVIGTVQDRDGHAISGAVVTVAGSSTTTDANGAFLLNNVHTGDRCYVRTSAVGFFDGTRGTITVPGGITQVQVTMVPNTPTHSFAATSDENATLPDGSALQLLSSSLVTAQGQPPSGSVNLCLVHLDPSMTDFASVTPGGDLVGVDGSGGERQLLSYGMVMVRLTDDAGNELELAQGTTATVIMTVPPAELATAPATIPLWHFDEVSGKWNEEGTATLQGSTYVGTVQHFSSWNCDHPEDRGRVHGTVRDCNGQPVPGITVRVGQVNAVTDANGSYEANVPSATAFTVQVEQPGLGLVSAAVSVDGVTSGDDLAVNDLTVACPGYVSVTLTCTGGSQPWGFVAVNVDGHYAAVPYTATGTYRIAVPTSGASATVDVVRSGSSTQHVSVTLPNTAGQVVDAGSFNICEQDGGGGNDYHAGFTITGNGYTNAPFVVNTNGQFANAWYSAADAQTFGFATGGSVVFEFGSPGNTSGSWTFTDGSSDATLAVLTDGKTYMANNATLNVTAYGNVGGTISGSFSGEFVWFDPESSQSVPVTITGGTFYLLRTPDQ